MENSTSTIIVPAYDSKLDEFVALQVSGKKLVNITKDFEADCTAFGRDGSIKLWYCHEHNDLITGTKTKKGIDYKGTRPSIRTFVDPAIVVATAKELKLELPKKMETILNNLKTLINKKAEKSTKAAKTETKVVAKVAKKAGSKKNQNPTSKKADVKVVPTVEVAKS